MNIIFVAPPAAGKGTQSNLLVEKYGIAHISTGDLLREEVASGSDLGLSLKDKMASGELISDDIVLGLLKNRLMKDDVKKGFTKAERIIGLQNPILQLAINTAVFLASILGAILIVRTNGSEMSVEDLQSVIQYGVQILMSLMFLAFVSVMISLAVSSAKRIAEVLNEESTIKNPENPIYEVSNGEIEFKNVSFKYSENAKRNALENINIKIKSGQTVGIIGGTGSSKQL